MMMHDDALPTSARSHLSLGVGAMQAKRPFFFGSSNGTISEPTAAAAAGGRWGTKVRFGSRRGDDDARDAQRATRAQRARKASRRDTEAARRSTEGGGGVAPSRRRREKETPTTHHDLVSSAPRETTTRQHNTQLDPGRCERDDDETRARARVVASTDHPSGVRQLSPTIDESYTYIDRERYIYTYIHTYI